SGGSMGIGFAIPTSLVEQVMNALIKDGRVSRGWLGIEIQSQLRDPTQLETSTGV
ncbi:MAG TPA: serine protease, partial [Psychrobacter sp.]|nr:serine protease [Psychrobacter sp.]